MSTSRIFASHGLVILLFHPACQTWRPGVVPAQTGYQQAGRVRIASKASSNDSLIFPARRPLGRSAGHPVVTRQFGNGDRQATADNRRHVSGGQTPCCLTPHHLMCGSQGKSSRPA